MGRRFLSDSVKDAFSQSNFFCQGFIKCEFATLFGDWLPGQALLKDVTEYS